MAFSTWIEKMVSTAFRVERFFDGVTQHIRSFLAATPG